jgi:hypothetical protein
MRFFRAIAFQPVFDRFCAQNQARDYSGPALLGTMPQASRQVTRFPALE